MKTAKDLTRKQLEAVVDCVQQTLYLDKEVDGMEFWNPDKEWDLNEDVQSLVALLDSLRLVPGEVVRS